ncbi:hypothetical protein F5J12DRAFT_823448 [Pisolithus orientalis]|uniref:uncharacterized protein n=1 Tax=Pisolithus orientalis TaxID=936130 RepID=UPI0022251705|nr:uncharacterized protein F5J12DRAFT_823448 [Pisolithus orientalis]KAI6009410.1 hypothetical protein F5J12DRAFT_823448 [Pisolithus orientalis]
MLGLISSVWLVAFTFFIAVRTYTIDDSNYSVLKFSENPAGPVWGPFGSDTGEQLSIRLPNGTMMAINSAQCYDGTFFHLQVLTGSCSLFRCSLYPVPTLGSGITIYVLQAGPQGMSASLSIDSGTATTATLGAPPAPQYNIPQVVLFDVQNLVSGNHTAIMTVLDWDDGFSGMMLDYIDVNDAVVAGTTPTTPVANQTPTPTTTQSSSNPSTTVSVTSQSSQSTTTASNQTSSTATPPAIVSSLTNSTSTSAAVGATSSPLAGSSNLSTSSSSKINVGAIAGGAAAGAVGLLALCALVVLFFRRRRSRSSNGNTTPLLRRPESRFLAGPFVDPFARTPTVPGDGSILTVAAGELSGASIGGADAGTTPDIGSQSPSLPSSTAARFSPQGGSAAQSSVPDISSAPVGVSPLRQLPAIPISPGDSREANQAGGTGPNSQSRMQPVLTDEQADFVTSLYQNNVPAPVVARVLERMLANPNPSPYGSNPGAAVGPYDPELRAYMPMPASGHRRVLSWLGSQVGDAESTAPPSYDHAQTHS